MTGRERFLRSVRGKSVDYPSSAPYMGNFCLHAAGYSLSECYTDAKTMAEAQIDAWRMFSQDVIVVQSDNYYMAEAFGARVSYPSDALPVLAEALIKEPSDVFKLTPMSPKDSGRMPVYIEAMRRIVDSSDGQPAIRGCGTGPFVLAGHLCGLERLLLWLAETDAEISDHSVALDYMFKVGLETLLAFAEAQLEAGATVVQLADSLASLNVISPDMYRKYVLPYEKQFFARIKPVCESYGAVALLHICGDNTEVFDDYVDTGADIIAVDHAADLSVISAKVGDKVALIGNLDPSGVLLHGNARETATVARKCLDTMASRRYVLGTGCEVSIDTPEHNIHSLLSAAREHRSVSL